MSDSTSVHGDADEGFGLVADTFAELFAEGAELGAAVTVYRRGRPVVDLHGGVADSRTGLPWDADTLAVGFSVTKGLMALCAQIARQRGLLDFDVPVAAIWPEYAVNGKEETTVRELFTHRAGVPYLDVDLTIEGMAQWDPVIHAIERQRPHWRPGTTFAYHALTYGWLTGEILCRTTGLRPGALLREYLTGPLEAEAWIGLPGEYEPRVARTVLPPTDPAVKAQIKRLSASATFRALTVGVFPPTLVDDDAPVDFNSPVVRALELPAANGILSAHGLARIYAGAVSALPDTAVGPLLEKEGIVDATTVRSEGEPWPEASILPGIRFSTGFMINGIPSRPMLSDASFGHDGASGSLGFADAGLEIGFGYVNNRMNGFGGGADDRAARLVTALRRCL